MKKSISGDGSNLYFFRRITFGDHARLFFQLRRQGTPIPTNDLWIAALVSQHNLTLLSDDHHFAHLPQLPLVQ